MVTEIIWVKFGKKNFKTWQITSESKTALSYKTRSFRTGSKKNGIYNHCKMNFWNMKQ